MNLKRFWIIFKARNLEFFRDKEAFGWNILFPFLIVAGFAIIFDGKNHTEYKVGLFPSPTRMVDVSRLAIPERLKETRYIEFIGFESQAMGLDRLKHHKIDFLLAIGPPPHRYWVSDDSPKGYLMEKIFAAGFNPQSDNPLPEIQGAQKKQIQGRQIRYIDWLFPGILGMNMMFSALYGVGWVVVRYRKNGVLKRLKATPLTAFEFLSAQLISRIFILMFSVTIVWVGCGFLFHFTVEGRYLNLFLIFFLGGLSLSALGLILASRGTSEEFTNGVLNFITWPMMFLSEVWFSIEGAPDWVKLFAKIFPLTHILTGTRKIMNDGAGLLEVGPEIGILTAMTLLFLTVGASMFSWSR